MLMTWSCKELWGINMKLSMSVIFSLFLYGCSTLKTEQIDLYEVYVEQAQAAKNNTIVSNRESFFTSGYLGSVDPNDEKSLLLLNLSEYVSQEISYYQKIDNQKACLSINGIEASKEPISLHIEYKKENGLWLVDYMFLHFIESSGDYAREALCPREIESLIFK